MHFKVRPGLLAGFNGTASLHEGGRERRGEGEKSSKEAEKWGVEVSWNRDYDWHLHVLIFLFLFYYSFRLKWYGFFTWYKYRLVDWLIDWFATAGPGFCIAISHKVDGVINGRVNANLLPSVPMKWLWKSVDKWWTCKVMKSGGWLMD